VTLCIIRDMKFARKIPDWAKISSKNVSRWSRAGEEEQKMKAEGNLRMADKNQLHFSA